MSLDFKIVNRTPSVSFYMELRKQVGWSTVDELTVSQSLSKSCFSVCACIGGREVGCGRIIGDGIYYYVQDIIVDEEYRRQGVGSLIMMQLMSWLEDHTKPGGFVGLMAGKETSGFYQKFGFTNRENSRPGMYKEY